MEGANIPKQLFYEDVEVGMNISQLVKPTSTRQLVEYAGASRDFHEIHYDDRFARRVGFPGVIIHGCLKAAFLCQMLTDWMGNAGMIKKANVQYRAIDLAGEPLCCHGKTIKKYAIDGTPYIDCEIWVSNSKGEITTTGLATIILPSRYQK